MILNVSDPEDWQLNSELEVFHLSKRYKRKSFKYGNHNWKHYWKNLHTTIYLMANPRDFHGTRSSRNSRQGAPHKEQMQAHITT